MTTNVPVADPEIEEATPENEEEVNIEGLETQGQEPLSWDQKARDLMRQILTQKVDLPISRITPMIDEGEVDLAPKFQRRLRWTRAQQSRLIESIIMNVPIPPVFLGEHRPGQYVVLDGRQRLTALYEYLTGKFKLSGLSVWDELNGKSFKQLHSIGDPPIASAITRRFVPAVLILHESVPEVKYEVFDRLNTGGVIAEPMEVRNAIYRGAFNELLHTITDDQAFRTLWGMSNDDKQRKRNAMYKQMIDLEMALRFFAFQNYGAFNGSIKTFLTNHMAARNAMYAKEPELAQQDSVLFTTTMDRTLQLLGPDAFHRTYPDRRRSPVPSAPLADAVLYAISRMPPENDGPDSGRRIREIFDDLCVNDQMFVKSVTVGTNARTSVSYRIETASRRVLDLGPEEKIP